jgi:acyl carrier protein
MTCNALLHSSIRGARMLADRVRIFISEELCVPLDSVTQDARFAEDLGADSLDVVELAMRFEERFEVVVSEDEAESCICVADAVRLLEGKGAGRADSGDCEPDAMSEMSVAAA